MKIIPGEQEIWIVPLNIFAAGSDAHKEYLLN